MVEVPAFFGEEVHGAAETTLAFRLASYYRENGFVRLAIHAMADSVCSVVSRLYLSQTSTILDEADALYSSSSPITLPSPW